MYICDRLNENNHSNATIVLPPNFDTYLQTQRNIASDASVGENDVSSAGLDQSTNHHYNTDSKNNENLQSYETPKKQIVVPTLLVIQYPPQPQHNRPH